VFRRGLVRRPRLVDRLIAARDVPLATIVAPPGYGKSSLLSEWSERDRRTFVWLTPGEHAEGVEQQSDSVVLVLDDAHTLSRARLRGTVEPLLEDLPAGSMIAVASRTEPELPIGRLRAHRELVEIRMRDLAMTPAEAAVLLRRAGLELGFEAVQVLVRDTEGWPAALYLAALSMRQDPELDDAPRFGGDDHLLSEFLRDEVLSAMPADLTDFVMRSAVLEELSGPVCDAVLDEHGSALALARLEKLSPLLVPLDRAHNTYRWQRLFASALRAELRRAEPDVGPALQLRASDWYAARGETDPAIEHAVAAGDPERVGELLWENVLAYVARGRTALVERWLACFRHDQIAADPRLALSAAHCSLAAGKIEHARHWATAAAALAHEQPSLQTGLVVIELMLARGGTAEMQAAAAGALASEPNDSSWRPTLCLLTGVAEHLLGRREDASALLVEGAELSWATAPSVASLCLAVDAMIAVEREDWDTAVELTDRAEKLVRGGALAESPLSALVLAASAAVRAHEGRVDEAKRDLRCGVELLGPLGDCMPWYGAEARILLAHASLRLADLVRARSLLAEASRLARKTPDAVIFERWFDQAWAYMDTLAESTLSGPSSLTIAELRILRFLPSHRSFREIATQLGVSANTVKTQAHSVYRKLGAASRSEAVARASEAGLLCQ
jgi:LuxR family maltose regulon positive regulatory protein